MSKETRPWPINAVYLAELRDKRRYDRPIACWCDKTTGEVIRQRDQLDSIDMLIYIMLLSRANKDDLTCWPAISTISQDCGGIDRRTLWEHLTMLEQMDMITTTKRPGQSTVFYMLDFAKWLAEHD